VIATARSAKHAKRVSVVMSSNIARSSSFDWQIADIMAACCQPAKSRHEAVGAITTILASNPGPDEVYGMLYDRVVPITRSHVSSRRP
jgi:hypothetical protein